jgi:hypothetical protein
MRRLHLGTLIDKSYYESFIEKDKYDKYHLKKICPYCNEIVDLGFSDKEDLSAFAGTLPHECKIWVNEARHRIGAIENIYLTDNGFIFEEKREIRFEVDKNMAVGLAT